MNNKMKHNHTMIATALLGFGLAVAGCDETSNDFSKDSEPWRAISEDLIAFPGAEGCGCHATGGRGGDVYHVTTLDDTGASGSLRYAVTQTGARTIVFDVAGTINLTTPLDIANGDLTIAGQSAPGDGICIAGAEVRVNASNVIIRYLRFRPGNDVTYLDPTTGDPVIFNGLSGTGQQNIIIDHCTFSWAAGKCLALYNNRNTTVQWCMLSEALHETVDKDDVQRGGAFWGGTDASFHHNLLAHCMDCMPRFAPGSWTQKNERVDVRNNVFYNWGEDGACGGEGMKANIVGNYYKPGPATALVSSAVRHRIFAADVRTEADCHKTDEETGEILLDEPNEWYPMQHVWGKFFIDGNVMEGDEAVTADNWTEGVLAQVVNGPEVDNLYTEGTQDTIRLAEPLDMESLTVGTAEEAYRLVLAYAGCAKRRDTVDERVLQEVQDGTATYGTCTGFVGKGFINDPDDVGGYPTLTATDEELAAIKDSDGDGMPDEWEKAHGLNPNADADGRMVKLSEEGYTNLEVYLNSLVEDITNNS